MRLGMFGGSFDPPHFGHLLPVLDAAETLGLDEVRFIPTARQPLKPDGAAASARHRLEMTKRLVERVPGFTVDSTEIDRGGLSWTVDTVSGLAAAHPGTALFLLVGADAYERFQQWREPERIRAMATVAVLVRGGDAPPPLDGGPVQMLETRRVDISSTELRSRVASGLTIRGFMPDAVADYIAEHRLYR